MFCPLAGRRCLRSARKHFVALRFARPQAPSSISGPRLPPLQLSLSLPLCSLRLKPCRPTRGVGPMVIFRRNSTMPVAEVPCLRPRCVCVCAAENSGSKQAPNASAAARRVAVLVAVHQCLKRLRVLTLWVRVCNFSTRSSSSLFVFLKITLCTAAVDCCVPASCAFCPKRQHTLTSQHRGCRHTR